MVMTMVTMMVSMVVAMMTMSIGMNVDNNIGPSIVATIVVWSTEASVIWLTDDHIWLLLDHCCLLDLLSLWVPIGSRLVVSCCDSAWPHRWSHRIRLCRGCGRCGNALYLTIHVDRALGNRHWWWNNHLIHDWLRSVLLWMFDQGVELSDLVLRLLIHGLRCEVG